jgi:hypothetical protein
MNPSDDSILFSQICPPCNDTNKQMMEGIEQLTQRQDDAPVPRRKQVSSMRKTTTGSKGKGGGRKKKPKFITTDWEMVLQSNSGMVTQTSSAGNIITMMGVTKKMNGGNADDDFNDFAIGAGGRITSSVVTCVPVSLGAGEGQYRVPAGKRATKNEEMFKAPSRDGSACMVCKYEERGRGARVSACLTHGIRACLDAQPNWQSVKPLMKQGKKHPVTDWSWICPGNMMTCWDNAHLWHRPQKLWSELAQQGDRVNHVFYAANIRTTSDLYKKKMAAIGRSQSKRDGRSSNKRQILERKRRLHRTTSESVASNKAVQYRIHIMQN